MAKLTYVGVLDAKAALDKLMDMEFPIKESLDIAILSNLLEKPINAFSKVRDRLFKQYAIKAEPGEKEGSVKFTSTDKENPEKNLQDFGREFGELLETDAGEINFRKIRLTTGVLKPARLKPLTEFIEVVSEKA